MRGRRRGELLDGLNLAKQRGRACRQNASSVRTAVRIHVLQRFVAVIVMIRTVVMVMMQLVVEMHCSVRHIFAVRIGPRAVCHGERVPQQSQYEHEDSGRFAHGANLAETRHTVEPAERAKCY